MSSDRICRLVFSCVFFQAEDGIRDLVRSRGLGDVYKRQGGDRAAQPDRRFGRHAGAADERRDPGDDASGGQSLSLIHI